VKITPSEVEHVADLGRLSFTPDEINSFSRHLNDILTYVATLERLDTSKVEPTSHVVELTNVFREDRTEPSLPVDESLSNAAENEGGTFIVPRII
jgi:aspartyl-tRNA(Asn)/glutamyl-tRNA(Gln) amidotransferase subunit C